MRKTVRNRTKTAIHLSSNCLENEREKNEMKQEKRAENHQIMNKVYKIINKHLGCFKKKKGTGANKTKISLFLR